MAPSSGRKERRNPPTKEEIEARNIVNINKETVSNTVSNDYPGNYIEEDHAWDIDHFRDNLRVEFHQNDDYETQFSLIGVDASIANAFRRILIAEIPTLAIETVYVNNNTSVIQDEVLAHRLGLIPFTGSKKGICDFMKFWKKGATPDDYTTTFDNNTVKLSLKVECTHNKDAKPEEKDPTKLYHHAHVYAKDILFEPEGDQAKYFHGDGIIRPTNPDILIAKMRPGQEINVEMHMHKGVGSDHSKFSPVATASYRLMPVINILQPILREDTKKFAECFIPGTIALEKVTEEEARTEPYQKQQAEAGDLKAVVANPMYDTVSREVLRHKQFEGKVKLGRRKDHFIFSIESTGQWESDELFLESVRMFKLKCQKLRPMVVNMSHR